MWQRAQTLYLLISAALMAALFFSFKAEDIRYVAYLPYTVLISIITILNLIALSAFKFRIFQFRTVLLKMLITIAFQAWLAVDFFATMGTVVFKITAVFPIVCVIFDILAARGIWADELIVRSASRLRSAKRKTLQK